MNFLGEVFSRFDVFLFRERSRGRIDRPGGRHAHEFFDSVKNRTMIVVIIIIIIIIVPGTRDTLMRHGVDQLHALAGYSSFFSLKKKGDIDVTARGKKSRVEKFAR